MAQQIKMVNLTTGESYSTSSWRGNMENEELSDYELHEMYDDFLDECYPQLNIAGLPYQTSRVLKDVDPTAYRCGFADWLDGECEDGGSLEAFSNEKGMEAYRRV